MVISRRLGIGCGAIGIVLGGACAIGTAPKGAVVALQGTGRATVMGRALLVSPDEKWICFFEKKPGGIGVNALASVDMSTGRYMRYDLSGVAEASIPIMYRPLEEKLSYLAAGKKAMGWRRDRLYIDFFGASTCLALSMGTDDVQVVAFPDSGVFISDGIADADRDRLIRVMAIDRDVHYVDDDMGTMAWRDGRLAGSMYWYDQTSNVILAKDENGTGRQVWKIPQSGTSSRVFAAVRVSPNEQFVAIMTIATPRTLLPTPSMRTVLTVVETNGGKALEMASYRYMGNCIWGRDSRHLYFIGGGDTDTTAVRIADVAGAFGR